MRRLGAGIAAVAFGLALWGTAEATSRKALLSRCAYGSSIPMLKGYEAARINHDAWSYADRQAGAGTAQRTRDAHVFAAAAAAYAYGLALVNIHETVKRFEVRNLLTSIDALQTPANRTTVSPNVDTAYTVGWIDLTGGPVVISVPNTGGRYYTIQLMDAYSNSYAYIGSGSTGTRAGNFAIVPPKWSGTLPAGVKRIKSPTNTDWLLGRTQLNGVADEAHVKPILKKIVATPLAEYELGQRGVANVMDSYPKAKPIATPTGTSFIATLNQEMTIDPPASRDDCAVRALSEAGVVLPHPTNAESTAADYENGAGDPKGSTAATPTNQAIKAGTADAVKIIASATHKLETRAAKTHFGWDVFGNWVGNYGKLYLPRAIVATGLLGANIPRQAIYPLDYQDVMGKKLTGRRTYKLTFPRGKLPPVRAFWSLTMYGPDNYLYANRINRYEVSSHVGKLVLNGNGSLTIYIQHAGPRSRIARANWLPAPAGAFHLILRLYEPKASAFNGKWKIPPVIARGEHVPTSRR